MSFGGARDDSGPSQGEAESELVLTRRRVHPVLVVIAVVGCLHLFFLLAVEFDRSLVHRREVARLESEVESLTAELRQLEQVAAHAQDQAYREVLARKQGFVYPYESLLVTRPE